VTLFAMVGLALLAAPPKHFDIAASFLAPPRPGTGAAVGVLFSPLDSDVHVNEDPAPRLQLDPGQKVLVDKQPAPPSHAAETDPDKTRYLDVSRPVKFKVEIAAGAPKGPQTVKAKVVYFYCSKREGWCRRGSEPLELTVDVP